MKFENGFQLTLTKGSYFTGEPNYMASLFEPKGSLGADSTTPSKLARCLSNLFQSKRKRILLVEDEEDLQTLYSNFLTSRHYRVKTVGKLEEAQTCLKNDEYDLVLQDIVLPDGNGVYAISEMKRQHPNLPIIILTALGYDEDLLQTALRDGASSFISKMLPLDQIVMEIHRVLEQGKN
jgi:DNA-binding NtrC family response regulator